MTFLHRVGTRGDDEYIVEIEQDCSGNNPRHEECLWRLVGFSEEFGYAVDTVESIENYEQDDIATLHQRLKGDFVVPFRIERNKYGSVLRLEFENDSSGDLVDVDYHHGYAVVTEAKMKEWFVVSKLSKATRNTAYEVLRGEVLELNYWINGEVYGMVLKKRCGECGEYSVQDSCWGYYGYDGIEDEAQTMINLARA